jgi:hypothetical protein
MLNFGMAGRQITYFSPNNMPVYKQLTSYTLCIELQRDMFAFVTMVAVSGSLKTALAICRKCHCITSFISNYLLF